MPPSIHAVPEPRGSEDSGAGSRSPLPPPAKTLRVLLVDDHAMVRDALRHLLASTPEVEIVGEAEDGREALARCGELTVDVVVMDLAMPGLDGIEATRLIRAAHPRIHVLAFSGHQEMRSVRAMLEAGAIGYVLKRATPAEFVCALLRAAAGVSYLDARIVQADQLVDPCGHPPRGTASLTGQEFKILQAVARGYSNKEIGQQFDVSVKTIESYRSRAMAKLGLRSRLDLMRHAAGHGWLR